MIRTGYQRAITGFVVLVFSVTAVVWSAGGFDAQPSEVGPATHQETP